MGRRTPKAVIVDYGMGNLYSVERAVHFVGGRGEITSEPRSIATADRVILPGVGAFGIGMENLRKRHLDEAIQDYVQREKPLWGICLGMQVLATEGHEFGLCKGLNLIEGTVVKLQDPSPGGPYFKIPHIGWNTLRTQGSQEQDHFLSALGSNPFLYFVHSFIMLPKDFSYVLATTRFGKDEFCSVLAKDTIYGCQFHPERSGEVGLAMYKQFLFHM